MIRAGRPTHFLDRHGAVHVDRGCVCGPKDWELIDRTFDFCRAAQKRSHLIIVMTNQARIGRGYYSEAESAASTAWIVKR